MMMFERNRPVPQRHAPSWASAALHSSSDRQTSSLRNDRPSTIDRRLSTISTSSGRSSDSASSASTLPTPPFSRSSSPRLTAESKTMLGKLKGKFTKSSKNGSYAPLQREESSLFKAAPATRRPNRPGMNAFTTPSNEPPPPYSAATSESEVRGTPSNGTEMLVAPIRQGTGVSVSSDDDPYDFLRVFDTVFLIDDSGSMAGRSWRETSAALEQLTPILVEHDEDGIDIHFLNAPDQEYYKNVKSSSTVHEIFNTVRPNGGTPTGRRLNQILKPYLERYKHDTENTKPLNVIVITDGVPGDDVESVLISTAQKLDRYDADLWQVGIQFFQVGEEIGAGEHLRSLDDELSKMGCCRDIVDTVPFVPGDRGRGMDLSAQNILKVVLGAVNRRLDRQSQSST